MASHYLAFDLGAESGRAMLGTLSDGRLQLDELHRFPNPTGRMLGRLHWNLLQQWEELKTGLRNAAAKKIVLAGIGVDTWGVDFGLLDARGNVLGNPLHYRDAGTDGILERAFKSVPREELYATTGIQFMQFNSLFQLLARKLADDSLLRSADKLLFMPDLFHYLFTGVARAEFSIASTSQMLDPRTGQWATGLIERFGLPTKILPEVVPSGTILGTLSESVRAECGCGEVRVITPASHDTGSAVAAAPAEGEDWCYISSGTWSLVGVELKQPKIDSQTLQYNYTNEGGVGGSIRFLKNVVGLWLVQECRRQFKAQGYEHSYGELVQMANRATPFGAFVDPDHGPFLAPGEMVTKIEQYCHKTNQPHPGTRGQIIRCCLESLALTYRKTIEGLEKLLARKLSTIHILGGGSQNELLNQMTADACGKRVVAGPVEATAIGNLLVQAIATGELASLSAARGVVRESFGVKTYEPQDVSAWNNAYSRFQSILGK